MKKLSIPIYEESAYKMELALDLNTENGFSFSKFQNLKFGGEKKKTSESLFYLYMRMVP